MLHECEPAFDALHFLGQLFDRLEESFHVALLLPVRKSVGKAAAIAIDFALQTHGRSLGKNPRGSSIKARGMSMFFWSQPFIFASRFPIRRANRLFFLRFILCLNHYGTRHICHALAIKLSRR